MRKTKIVCTLGPSTDDEAVLRELILSCRRHAGCRFQLFYKLPGVERIQKVDIARSAVQNANRQVATVVRKNFRRLLVRVAAVFQFQFFHIPKNPHSMSPAALPHTGRRVTLFRICSRCGPAFCPWQGRYTAQTAKPCCPRSGCSRPFL